MSVFDDWDYRREVEMENAWEDACHDEAVEQDRNERERHAQRDPWLPLLGGGKK